LPVNSLDELLKYAASVEIQQRGPAGAQADIVVRGGTFQQVLVLMDGVKINDPITGHFSGYMPIVASQIERIEILRGPAAAAYGSEAVGAVINIISKTFATFNKEKTLRGNAGVATGEYGYLMAHAGVQKTNEKINYSVAAQTTNADGQLLRGNNRGYFNNHLFSANAAIALNNKWKAMLQSSYDDRDFAAQNFYTTFASDTAVERVITFWSHAKLKRESNNSSDEIDIAYKKTNDVYQFNPAANANDNTSGLLTLQYIHSKKINASLFYNAGIMAEQRSIKSNDRGNHSNQHISAFGSVTYKYKKLSFNPGVRVVSDKNYGIEILPQANLLYRAGKLGLRANAGRAIRSADFTERYNNYNRTRVTGGSIGNPDLEAERSWSYEAGADLYLKNWKISAAWFYRDQNNVIDYVATPYADMPRKENLVPNGSYALAKNIKAVNTRGLELELSYQQKINEHSQLYVNAAATFLKSSSTDAVPSFYIISHARTLLQQSVVYNFKKLNIAVTSIYKERNRAQAPGINAFISPNYWLVNVKTAYQINRFNVFVAVNNVGNIRYSDLLGSKMPQSWTTAGVNLYF
jgi:iron complex outermembrane receptor protein